MRYVEDRRTFEPTESTEDAERLFIEDFDTWDMTGYYLYSKLLRAGVPRHIGTWGSSTTAMRAALSVFISMNSDSVRTVVRPRTSDDHMSRYNALIIKNIRRWHETFCSGLNEHIIER
jgi:hypothetical protein